MKLILFDLRMCVGSKCEVISLHSSGWIIVELLTFGIPKMQRTAPNFDSAFISSLALNLVGVRSSRVLLHVGASLVSDGNDVIENKEVRTQTLVHKWVFARDGGLT